MYTIDPMYSIWRLTLDAAAAAWSVHALSSNLNGVDTTYTTNILHVCIHKNVLTMFQQKLHLLVNSE